MATILTNIAAQVLYPDFMRVSGIVGQSYPTYPYLNEGNETVINLDQPGLLAGHFLDSSYSFKFPADISSKITAITGGVTVFTFSEIVSLATTDPNVEVTYVDSPTNKVIGQITFITNTGEKYVKTFETDQQ